MSHDDPYKTASGSDSNSIWVQDTPEDWPQGGHASKQTPRGDSSKRFWAEDVVLSLLPWVIVIGFVALGSLALLGLITFY
jgi:hypothetical protein